MQNTHLMICLLYWDTNMLTLTFCKWLICQTQLSMFLNPSLAEQVFSNLLQDSQTAVQSFQNCRKWCNRWCVIAGTVCDILHKRVVSASFLFIVELNPCLFYLPVITYFQEKGKSCGYKTVEGVFFLCDLHSITHVIRSLSLPFLTFGRKGLFQKDTPHFKFIWE